MTDRRPTVAVLTPGCKLNQRDSETIARRLGLTGNYIRVYTSANKDLPNRPRPSRLVRLEGEGVRAELAVSGAARR